jgi:hypothetical protein
MNSLGDFGEGQAVRVLVQDGLADHQHADVGKLLQEADDLIGGMAGLEPRQVLLGLLRVGAEEPVGQRAGAVQLGRGEADHSPRRLDRRLFVQDLARHVGGRIRVVLALRVNVGPDQADRLHRGGILVEADAVDVLQRGQRLRPQPLVEDRPPGPLVHEAVGGNGHDEVIPEGPGLLEVQDVTGMEDVEHAVAEDDPLSGRPDLGQPRFDFRDGADLIRWRHVSAYPREKDT